VPIQGYTLPYSLYRASVPVQGRALPYSLFRVSVPCTRARFTVQPVQILRVLHKGELQLPFLPYWEKLLAYSKKVLNEPEKSPFLCFGIKNSARPATDCRCCARRGGTEVTILSCNLIKLSLVTYVNYAVLRSGKQQGMSRISIPISLNRYPREGQVRRSIKFGA
jgi:hypothetical protein